VIERRENELKIIAIGDNVVDRYINLNKFYPGGNALNVAVFAHRYGAMAAYIGCIGNDRAGQHIYNVLLEEGVDASRIQKVDAPNRYAVVKLTDGDREFLPGGNKETTRKLHLTKDDFEFMKRFQVIHTSINSYIEKFLPELKSLERTVSFDYSDWYYSDYLESTLPYVDYAFFSDSQTSLYKIKLFLEDVLSKGPKIAIVTRGPKGVILYDGKNFWFQPVQIIKVVDTLGGGDSFIASFLVNFHTSHCVQGSLKKAVQNALETCTYYGAFGYGLDD